MIFIVSYKQLYAEGVQVTGWLYSARRLRPVLFIQGSLVHLRSPPASV